MSIKSFVSAHVLQAAARWVIYTLCLLLPIFFLSFSIEILETSKQLLLVVLSIFALLFWFGSVLAEKKFVFRGGWFVNLLPLLFLVSVFVSSVFSLAGYRTWIGQSSQEYTSFLTLFSLIALFFTVVNLAEETVFIKKIFSTLMFSAAIAGLLSWPYLFGWESLNLLPDGLSNTVGSVTIFAVYLIVMSVLGLGVWLVSNKKNLSVFLSTMIVLLSAILFCLSIDFWLLWILLALGSVTLVGFSFSKKETKMNRLAVPILLLVFSSGLIFLASPVKLNTSLVITPSYVSSYRIVSEVLLENPTRFLIGSGPGTFIYDYARHKPLEVNETFLWNTNFDRAKANFLTMLATIGILGVGLWLVFVLALFFKALKNKVEPTFLVSWLILVVTQIFYASNITLSWLFWILSALLLARAASKGTEIHFSRAPRIGLAFSLGFAVVVVASATSLLAIGGRYLSEVNFAKAVQIDQAGVSADKVTAKIGQALVYNNFSEIYYKNYSQALLKQLGNTLSDYTQDSSELNEEETVIVQRLIVATISAVDRAVALAPNDVSVWSQRGNIYRNLMSLVGESEDAAAASYLRASQLEPNNPLYLINLGRLYLVVADRAAEAQTSEDPELVKQAQELEPISLASAEEYLSQAVDLKPDYALTHYYLAAVYERQNKITEAITRLEILVKANPNSTGLSLQLALLQIRAGNYGVAQAELEKLISLNPNYSNARWYLASVYEFNDDLDLAIEQVSKVLELNPDNQTVKSRLNELVAGKIAAELPPPVEEEGSEVLVDGELVE